MDGRAFLSLRCALCTDGAGLQRGPDIEEPVGPRERATGEDGTAHGDEQSGLGARGGLPTSVRRGDCPRGGADDEHQHCGDEAEGQERADDVSQLVGAAYGTEVWTDERQDFLAGDHVAKVCRVCPVPLMPRNLRRML